jgi:hypothetical protein
MDDGQSTSDVLGSSGRSGGRDRATSACPPGGGELVRIYGKRGKPDLRQRVGAYNRDAVRSPWIVLVDLDRDADCAPPLRALWLPRPAPMMCFRVAVRAMEAWLLADREQLARFLSVPAARVPLAPEAVPDPKRAVVDLAIHSRRRAIREDMVPRVGSGRPVGPAYASRLIEFVEDHWRPEIAAQSSDSLRRCCERVDELIALLG